MKLFSKALQYRFSGKKTLLYDFHVAQKGKIVQFGGYELPINYPKGITKQHLHCRQSASLFDVSHMGQLQITGPDRIKLLERATVGSSQRIQKNGISEAYLTLFLNEKAGIIDDSIVSILREKQIVRIVCNASNKLTVLQNLIKISKTQYFDVQIDLQENVGLLALQGPLSSDVLQRLVQDRDLKEIPFMSYFEATIKGKKYKISRSGYTGEDGFQIGGNQQQTLSLVDLLMNDDRVQLAGLGARDSLRLQAGLCLHGHQMSTQITPFQAGLMWTVHKRQKYDHRLTFVGEQYLHDRIAENKSKMLRDRKRVGFIVSGQGIPRQGTRIYNESQKQIGIVTSGTFSPSLRKSIGMAYMDQGNLKSGTQIFPEVRGKKINAIITKMPFVPSKYYKGWKSFS